MEHNGWPLDPKDTFEDWFVGPDENVTLKKAQLDLIQKWKLEKEKVANLNGWRRYPICLN